MSENSKKKYKKPEPGTEGYRIMQARKAAGFTQAKLADRLGISRSMLVMYEHNEAQMRTDIVFKFVKILGISFDEVFRPQNTGDESEKED